MLINVSTEGLVMLVATGLYLGDSALFFEPDEGVLVRRVRGGWFAGFGLDRWRLGGREPYLPNPFTPFRPMFRLRWRFEAPAPDWGAPDSVVAAGSFPPTSASLVVPKELYGFGIHASASAVLLFVLLPVVLFVPVHVSFVMAVVVAFYINNVWAMVRLMGVRHAFKLDRKGCAAVAFECLTCPPFAVNLVRKLCAKLAVTDDLVAAGARVMSAGAYARLRSQCLRRIDEQIDGESEGAARMRALRLSRASYSAGVAPRTSDSQQPEAEQP